MNPSREQALNLFKKYNKSDSLYRHALSVEAVMRYMAEKYGEDPDEWGLIGLIHDLDYEMFRAVVSHGWGIVSDVEPLSKMEKTLYAMDELTGLVNTSALIRPSKSIMDMEARSVKKKWNDKRFAAGVDRSVIENGADMLGIELSEMIHDCIMAMRNVADEIGLRGTTTPLS